MALPIAPAPKPASETKAPEDGESWNKPIPAQYAWMLLIFCMMAASKELVKTKTPAQYKWVAAGVLAGLEGLIYLTTGYSSGDPKIMDVMVAALPPFGLWIGFDFVARS